MRSLLAPSAKPHASIYAASRVLLAAGFGKIDNPPYPKPLYKTLGEARYIMLGTVQYEQ
jgi:hypothetical protein